MKKRTIILLQILLVPAVFLQCIFPNQGPAPGDEYNEKAMEIETDSTTRQLFITVGSRKFAADKVTATTGMNVESF